MEAKNLAELYNLDALDWNGVVEVIEAGKSPDAHTISQDEINAVLVERAQAGRRVVRLKGGDPFVLGRGGEELLACLAAPRSRPASAPLTGRSP